MNPEQEVLGTRTPRSGGIKVVDLSRTPLRNGSATPLHRRILEALNRDGAGILSQDELLESTEGYSPSQVELVLRDLSLRGLVRVLWRAPFRFMAFLTERGRLGGRYATALPGAIPA
ncbi:MAG: hypothetical protein LN413_03130 [Candidatus Thermoplasmatota archaeon]|nr:hypothetical protein [Candidatus Thermoplasmatota archaeon]